MCSRRLLSRGDIISRSSLSIYKASCALLMLRRSFLTVVGGELVIELDGGGVLPVYSSSIGTSGKAACRGLITMLESTG
jgi:hypothetical protein